VLRTERELGRHDAVEHDGAHARGIAPQVLEREPCAIGDPDQFDPLRAEPGASRLEVLYRGARRIEARVGVEPFEAALGERARSLRARGVGRGGQPRLLRHATVEGISCPGAALVEQHDVPAPEHFAEGG
jgi:hypothetical protein